MAHHYDDGPDIAATNEKIRKIEAEKEKLEREKEQILLEENLKETKAWQLSAEIKETKELIAELQKQVISKQLELNKLCTHEKIREEYRNYSGGYLDRAEHWTDYFCEVCGAKVDEKVEYGGFG